MLDIQSLERRWLRYKFKSYLPYLYAFSIIILTSIIYSVFFSPADSQPLIKQKAHEEISKESVVSKPTSSTPDTIILEPSMNFMQTMDTDPVPTAIVNTTNQPQQNTVQPRPQVPASTPLPKETILQSAVSTKEITPNKPSAVDKRSSTTIVKREDSPLNINELQDRFQSNPNPSLGLFIARYHYDHANYPEAYNYALKTNAINNKIEESWLIFAKSLVKMGKSDQAKKTLQLYISQSNSDNAKSLLDSLDKEPKK